MVGSVGYPDTIVLGGALISMQPDCTDEAQGLTIKDGRIIRLIRRSEVDDYAGPETEIIDLGDRTLMPGFVDVHAHAEVVCRTDYSTVDVRAPECGKVEDVLDVFSKYVAERGKGEWVVGQGNLFFDRKLAENRLPTRAELDSVSTDSPLALRAGGHITVLNSKALEIAGIDRNFQAPKYSVTGLPHVERDENGDPTGVVKEMDTLLPFPGVERHQLKTALKEGLRKYFTRFGVTTIGEISETIDGLESMDELAAEGELPTAMRIYLWAPGTLTIEKACNWQDYLYLTGANDGVTIQGLKLFSDGGFSAKSAAIGVPYIGEHGNCGSVAFPKYFFRRAFEQTQQAGLQIAVHANGDRAQEWICEQVTAMGGAPSGPTRTRIEHAANLLPTQNTRDWWARAGIIPVPQAVFLYTFGEYFSDYLGDYGTRGRFAYRTLIEEGWRLSGSSDVWIGSEREATNPFFSIWCCLKRQTYSGSYIDPDEAITIMQALRMHTLDAAATMGIEDIKGSLAPGKMADVIGLTRDPRKVSVDELRTLEPDYVMLRGKTVLNEATEMAEVAR
ncbi:amidohydrolase [Methyloligella sp. 2.7D]|uniref:amidohydrolase n=1 Tax=unclassified Methyloligella TaxID=2625955 RepID=UPI00157D5555|nr:amidohydrolase [Methyloligella sp. GL2]QKP76961.1 amidohydrolase [Methyloligella sp. GL2]